MLGQRIRQYLVIERLGTGGMGRVYRAADESLGRDVALKILDTGTENSSARLRAEAGALARVNHPGIATVYELMEEDGRLVMAMELVRGQTIQQLLEQVGVFAPRQAAEFCMQTLAILQHAHAAGVVHRDLKPGNLMITEGGSIKIMDFGIARLEGSMALTSAGTMLGTPAYMAPEQVLGHPIDARADLYAMGVVFFRLITAALPFKGVTPFEMAQSQVNDEPARATDVCDGLPPWVDDIVARALAKKPDDRFQSADEFREALARAIAIDTPQPGVAAAMEITEALPRPALPTLPQKQPQPRALWLTAAAALVLVTGLWMLIRANAAASSTGGDPDTGVRRTGAIAGARPAGCHRRAGCDEGRQRDVPACRDRAEADSDTDTIDRGDQSRAPTRVIHRREVPDGEWRPQCRVRRARAVLGLGSQRANARWQDVDGGAVISGHFESDLRAGSRSEMGSGAERASRKNRDARAGHPEPREALARAAGRAPLRDSAARR